MPLADLDALGCPKELHGAGKYHRGPVKNHCLLGQIVAGSVIRKSSSRCFSLGKSQAPGQYSQLSPDNYVGSYLFYVELNLSLGFLADLVVSPLTAKRSEIPSAHAGI